MDGIALDQLRAFDRVVREGSFSRAALALRIGQPAVSSRIQALEAALGGALFRRGRRITLTALGEGFLPYVRRALDVLAEGVEAARLGQEGRRGRITLGVLPSLAGAIVGPALAKLYAAHPEIDALVKSGEHEAMLAFLLDGIVDLALIAWPCPPALEPDLHALLVLREPVVLVAARRHPLARRRAVTQADVVRWARPLYRLRWWQSHHPAITRLTESTGRSIDLPIETALHLVRGAAGAGFFTRAVVAGDLARGALVEIPVRDLAPVTRDSALVRRIRAAPLSPAAAKLVTLLRAEAEALGLLRRATPAPNPAPAP
jgi:DNA-binding transcriptional LysR family regulator